MPEAYGTHHSKMMILFRHDDLAQYVNNLDQSVLPIYSLTTESSYTLPISFLRTGPICLKPSGDLLSSL